ncbi:MAG: hypothetical protein AB7I27_09060 [Bacteriovoracaceae bacterium]
MIQDKILTLNYKIVLSFLLLVFSLLPIDGHPQSKTTQYQDTHREFPGYIDFGLYQTYKLTPEEINTIDSKKMRELIEIYIRRYYDFYMYFSRDIILKQVHENYPVELLDPVIQKTLSASDAELKKLLLDIFHNEGGVARENKTINDILAPIIREWDIKKFGSVQVPKSPPFYSPNAIYLAYLKKMGLRPYDYAPPFYPKGMDPDEPKNVTLLGRQTNITISENEIKGQIIAFILGIIFGALLLKLFSSKK